MSRNPFLFLTLSLFTTAAPAEVAVVSPLNAGTAWGKTKLVKEAPAAITVSQFNVTFMTTRVAGARQGTGADKAQVTMRAELPLEDALAQSISDAGFAYLKKQLEAKGYAVRVHDQEALKASKTFQKYARKNDDAVTSPGGVVRTTNKDKVDERMAVYALGVPGANLGRDPGPGYVGYTELAIEMGGTGLMSLSVVGTIDFAEAETSATTSMNHNIASVRFHPKLRLVDIPAHGQPALNFHSTKAIGGKFWGGHVYTHGDRAWVKEEQRVNDGLIVYQLDDEAFRAAAGALLRTYLDQLIARVEDVRAKGK